MENATQALFIAAGVLIGVMILTLGVTLFNGLSSYVETSHNQIRFNELNSFNTQFLKYLGKDDLTIHDVITVTNIANENNSSYNLDETSRGNDSLFYVAVYLEGTSIESEIRNDENKVVNYLTDKNEKTYECSVINISQETGRVYDVYFIEN